MSQEETEERVSTAPGARFSVTLEARPTAGFSWRLRRDSLDAGVAEIEDEGWDPAPGLGGAARQRFTVRTLRPGATDVVFEYGRPGQAEATRRHRVRLTVG